MPPTLKRILWNGVPAALLLAGVGFVLAEAAELFLDANPPRREVTVIDGADPVAAAPASPLTADARRALPLTMAAWGFGLVAAYEGIRRLVKGPAKRPAVTPSKVPAAPDVDKMLEDLMRKAEADRALKDAETVESPSLRPAQ